VITVFAYGTLRDPEYQCALFGRALPMRAAELVGWRLVLAENGYLSIVAAPLERVAGALLELDDDDLALADRWEEVPRYARIAVSARGERGDAVPCAVYVLPTAATAGPPPGALAAHPRPVILAALRACRAEALSSRRTG
jgi:gamma-glutamylcyclotransferase (GGCT)/AIG2-like uncharacterized protein YtfP